MHSNFSTQLYNKLVHPGTIRSLMAGFFRDDKNAAIATLQKNGVAIANSAPMKAVHLAWLKAIKDSETFRDQAAAVLADYLHRITGKTGTYNFVNNIDRYYNDVSDISIASIDPNSFSTAALASGTPVDSSSVVAGGGGGGGSTGTTPDSSGGFWSSLGSIFTPSLIQSGIKTGLQAYSTNLTASANQSSERTALQIEQAKIAAAQAQTQANQSRTGMSTGTIVAIVAGSLIVLTVIIVLVTRKK